MTCQPRPWPGPALMAPVCRGLKWTPGIAAGWHCLLDASHLPYSSPARPALMGSHRRPHAHPACLPPLQCHIALATGGCGTGRPRPSGAGTSRRWTAGGQEPAVRRARPSTPCTGAAVCPGPLELCPVQGRGLGEWGLVLADPVGRWELECRLSQDHPPAGRAGQRPLRPAGGFPAGRGGFSSGAVSPRNR